VKAIAVRTISGQMQRGTINKPSRTIRLSDTAAQDQQAVICSSGRSDRALIPQLPRSR